MIMSMLSGSNPKLRRRSTTSALETLRWLSLNPYFPSLRSVLVRVISSMLYWGTGLYPFSWTPLSRMSVTLADSASHLMRSLSLLDRSV